MRLGELFAGYGGLGMAVEEVFGAELAWVSEWEAAPSKILAHHWPGVPNYGDVTKIDWAAVEPVDIISGGSPCQDLSLAGRRRGMTEGTRSNLWETMREGIATIKPKYVVWENVRGALSAGAISEMEQSEGRLGASGNPNLRAIGRVLGDLSDLGYDAEWRGLRAADVGATHGRFRVFLLASLPDAGSVGLEAGRLSRRPFAEVAEPSNDQPILQDSHLTIGDQRRLAAPGQAEGWGSRPDARGRSGASAADSQSVGWPQGWSESAGIEWGLAAARNSASTTHASRSAIGEHAIESSSEEARACSGHGLADHRGERPTTDWGPYAPAVRRWERSNGPAPRPTEPTGRDGGHRLSPAFVEWMMGLPEGWVTDVPGVNRNAQLKALGNGVVPQQAIAALSDMLAAFNQKDIAA